LSTLFFTNSLLLSVTCPLRGSWLAGPLVLSIKPCLLHSFTNKIEATGKSRQLTRNFPGVEAFANLKWTYDGAFEQLFGPGRVEFQQIFSKDSNGRGKLKLRFDWYIISISKDGMSNDG